MSDMLNVNYSRQTRSAISRVALTLSILGLIFFCLAYAGEWKTVHIDYPNEFPNDPGTGHGFRLKMLYWMSTGALLMLSHWLFCGLSTILSIVAVARKTTLLRNRIWQIAATINAFAALYALAKYAALKYKM